MKKLFLLSIICALSSAANGCEFVCSYSYDEIRAGPLTAPMSSVLIDTKQTAFEISIKQLASLSLINSGCLFRPDLPISRVEILKILLKTIDFNNPGWRTSYEPVEHMFSDVSEEQWFYDLTQDALRAKIIAPNEYFRPNDSITRQEFAKILYTSLSVAGRLPKVLPEITPPTRADIFLEFASSYGVFTGDDQLMGFAKYLIHHEIIDGYDYLPNQSFPADHPAKKITREFRPLETIRREHAAHLIAKAFYPGDDVDKISGSISTGLTTPANNATTRNNILRLLSTYYPRAYDPNFRSLNADRLTFTEKMQLIEDIKLGGASFGYSNFGYIGDVSQKDVEVTLNHIKEESDLLLKKMSKEDQLGVQEVAYLAVATGSNIVSGVGDVFPAGKALKLTKYGWSLTKYAKKTSVVYRKLGEKWEFIKLKSPRLRPSAIKLQNLSNSSTTRVVQYLATGWNDVGLYNVQDLSLKFVNDFPELFSDSSSQIVDIELAELLSAIKGVAAKGAGDGGASHLIETSNALQTAYVGKFIEGITKLFLNLLIVGLDEENSELNSVLIDVALDMSEVIPWFGSFVAMYNSASKVQDEQSKASGAIFKDYLVKEGIRYLEMQKLAERQFGYRLQALLQDIYIRSNLCLSN